MEMMFLEWLNKVYPDMPKWEHDFAAENHRRFLVGQIRFHNLDYFPLKNIPSAGQASTPTSAPTPKVLESKAPTKKKKEIGIEI